MTTVNLIAESMGGVAGACLRHTHFQSDHIYGSIRREDGLHGTTGRYSLTDLDLLDQVRINTNAITSFITVDIDAPQDEVDRVVEMHREILAWVVRTPHGAHAAVLVDRVHTDHLAQKNFLIAIKENVRVSMKGDLGYTGWSTRNPWKRGVQVEWISDRVWHMNELMDWFKDRNLWAGSLGRFSRQKELAKAMKDQSNLGRNSALFTCLTLQSHKTGVTRSTLEEVATRWQSHQKEPMTDKEVKGILDSVCRRARFKQGRDGVYITSDNRVVTLKDGELSAMGRRGGQHNSRRQQESRAKIAAERARQREDRAAYAISLFEDGMTAEQIADQMTVSVRVVRRYISEARTAQKQRALEMLTEGYSVVEVSDSLGMNERTVYRLQAKAQEARDEYTEAEEVSDERDERGEGKPGQDQPGAQETGADADSESTGSARSVEVGRAGGSREYDHRLITALNSVDAVSTTVVS